MLDRCPYRHETCPYFDRKPRKPLKRQGEYIGCSSDEHHKYFPRRIYQTAIEQAFREMPENKEQTCRWEHDEIHYGPDPKKPSLENMIVALTVKLDNPVPLEEM